MDWLSNEMSKDKKSIKDHKGKLINEIKELDKTEMFKPKEIKKISLIEKIIKILGNGKKR